MELKKINIKINHKTVQILMKILNLKCMVRLKKYKSYKGEVGRIADNILKRDFKADKPNLKWVTDITEFNLFGHKVYLSPILDLFNGEIVSYNIGYRPTFDLVSSMLTKAFENLPNNTKLILHSDQGWHYQIKPYQRMPKEKRYYSKYVKKR